MIPDSAFFIRRCIELAQNGAGFVAPNPMVGAVLVYDNHIIGEGYHHAFGEPHAEVNAINMALENGNQFLLEKAVLYVSLEPCSHSGKTPPCTDLISKNKIPRVVIGCKDPFPEVSGNGIIKLTDSGIKVETGILEKECRELNRRFFTYHTKKRPYVLIKYAQTTNHFIAPLTSDNKKISNEFTDILTHKWRSEESAIMVGTTTAQKDNPSLTVRNWKGKNPVRIVIDRRLNLPNSLNLFDHSSPTVIINEIKSEIHNNIDYVKIDFNENVVEQVLRALFHKNILSVMIEGGRNLINQFTLSGLWDEARIITADKFFPAGIPSPEISGDIRSVSKATGDTIVTLYPKQ